jgi:hypothetical protein
MTPFVLHNENAPIVGEVQEKTNTWACNLYSSMSMSCTPRATNGHLEHW